MSWANPPEAARPAQSISGARSASCDLWFPGSASEPRAAGRRRPAWAAAEGGVAAQEALPGGATGLPASHRPTTISRQASITFITLCTLYGIIHICPETEKPEMTKRWRMNPLFQKAMSQFVPQPFHQLHFSSRVFLTQNQQHGPG